MLLDAMQLGQLERAKLLARVREAIQAKCPRPNDGCVTYGLRVPYDMRERISNARSRHGCESMRDTLYAAALIGLDVMEQFPPSSDSVVRSIRGTPPPAGHVLSKEEVSRVMDEGCRPRQRTASR